MNNFVCVKCGTQLNNGFTVCPSCNYDSHEEIQEIQEAEIIKSEIIQDKINARNLGFKNLREYYKTEFYKMSGTVKKNIFGKRVVLIEFDPMKHVRSRPNQMLNTGHFYGKHIISKEDLDSNL